MNPTHKASTLFFALICAAVPLLSACAHAGDRLNILVMGEDADAETVRRNTRAFDQILAAVESQLHNQGFDVYKEKAITLDHFTQDRVRRSYQELIDIGRSVQNPPIDVAVTFKVYASMASKPYVNKVRVRMMGEMVNVNSGKFLGNFQVTSPRHSWTAPSDCSRECIVETVGEYSRILGQELGLVLASKLKGLEQENPGVSVETGGLVRDFTLVFENFTQGEVEDIRSYLNIYSGYKSHRPIDSRGAYWKVLYKTTIATQKLHSNLKETFRQLNLDTHITYSGQRFDVTKTSRHTVESDAIY